MKAIKFTLLTALLCLTSISLASGQVSQAPKRESRATSEDRAQTTSDRPADTTATGPGEKRDEPAIVIYLVGGGQLAVEEVRETNDGIWYKRGGVTTLLDVKRVVRIERPPTTPAKPIAETTSRSLTWTIADSAKVESFFQTRFGRPLPTTAFGQSDLHNRWGLDHRQGIDVGLHPDSVEGLALREFLTTERIPFMVFRSAIPGVATGPHIHIGNASHRFLPRLSSSGN